MCNVPGIAGQPVGLLRLVGRGVLKAARPAGTIASFVGLLVGRTQKVATIEEINEAAAQGWAGKQ